MGDAGETMSMFYPGYGLIIFVVLEREYNATVQYTVWP